MNNGFKKFDERVEYLASLRRAKIAFGMKEPNDEILESMKRSKKYADITLVGPQSIAGIKNFPVIINDNPEEKIAKLLVEGEFEGIIRGTIDDFKTREAYNKLTGETSQGSPGLMEDCLGHRFLLGPGSNPQGWSKEERLAIANGLIGFLKEWEIEPRVAVFTGVRHETYARKKDTREGVVGILNKTYEDAGWIVSELTKNGIRAKNWAIDLDVAISEGYNVIVPVNGMVGNQIFRAILLTGGRVLTGNHLGLSRFIEDDSRNERNYDFHVKWVVALINQKARKVEK